LDAVGAQPGCALLRTGDRTLDPVADPGQRVDEEGDGGAGAHAHDHPVLDMLDGLLAGQALGFAHGFLRLMPATTTVSTARPRPAGRTAANPCGRVRIPRPDPLLAP